MNLLGWFKKRNDIPSHPAEDCELAELLSRAVKSNVIGSVKQVEQSYVLKHKINEALSIVAADALKTVRKS